MLLNDVMLAVLAFVPPFATGKIPATPVARLTGDDMVFKLPFVSVVPSVDHVSPTWRVTFAMFLRVLALFKVTVIVTAAVSRFST